MNVVAPNAGQCEDGTSSKATAFNTVVKTEPESRNDMSDAFSGKGLSSTATQGATTVNITVEASSSNSASSTMMDPLTLRLKGVKPTDILLVTVVLSDGRTKTLDPKKVGWTSLCTIYIKQSLSSMH